MLILSIQCKSSGLWDYKLYIKSKRVTKVISRVIVFHVMVKEITNYLITNNWGNVFCDVKSWKYDYDVILMKLRSFQDWGFFNR